ncbi:MAG: hypothetical protein H7833_00420 [Magnetococcus sp. DMHC-1]
MDIKLIANMHDELVVIYVVISVIKFYTLGMQRTILLISRKADYPYKIMAILLPTWFPMVWGIIISRWIILCIIAIYWSWLIAAGILIVNFALDVLLPIPYHIYIPIFRKRLIKVKKSDPDVGSLLEHGLESGV